MFKTILRITSAVANFFFFFNNSIFRIELGRNGVCLPEGATKQYCKEGTRNAWIVDYFHHKVRQIL